MYNAIPVQNLLFCKLEWVKEMIQVHARYYYCLHSGIVYSVHSEPDYEPWLLKKMYEKVDEILKATL